jgi:quercetin dioxygenase-like cupin family protein
MIHVGADMAVKGERMTDFGIRGCRWILVCGMALGVLPGWPQAPQQISQPATKERGRVAFARALPALDGTHLKVTLVEVTYGPGESSHPHSHPCPVVGYVVAGAVRMQVKGGKEAIYRAGDTFYEAPHGVHAVSANASATEPATFLAYFVCDHEGPLSTPVAADERGAK